MADFPSILPDNENVELRANNQRFDSELTNSRQSGALSGPQWAFSATFNNRAGLEARELSTFVMALNGISTPFNYYPAHIEQLGNASGSIAVDGAGQTGTSLNLKDCPLSTVIFELGDYLTINGELKRITSQCTSDGAGLATVEFTPALRVSPDDSTLIEYTNPFAVVTLENDDQAQMQVSSPIIYSATFNMLEFY